MAYVSSIIDGMTERTFGPWLRKQLRGRWTQQEFADLVGTDQSSVSKWIRSARVPDPISCDRIADVLGIGVDYVLELAGHRPPVDDDSEIVREFVAAVRRINWDVPGRVATMRGIVDSMLSFDREQRG